MANTILDDLISEHDAAKQAGECRDTWARRRRARTGPAFIVIGKRILYRKAAIRDWILAQEVRPARRRAA